MSSTLFMQIGMIFLLALAGYFARKRQIITETVQSGLSSLVMRLVVPCSILASANMPFEKENIASIGIIFGGALLLFAVSILVMSLLAKKMPITAAQKPVFTRLGTFQNVAFIGFPVSTIFLPETGIFYATFFVVAFNLVFFTYGSAALSGQRNFSFKAILLNPNMLACFVMIILYLSPLRLPALLQNTLATLGGLATPLSMLVIGSMLAGFNIKEIFTTPSLYVISVLRLLVFPTLLFFILRALPLPHEAATTLLVMTSLPAASLTVMAAEQYGREPEYASKGVLLSTLLFGATVPYIAFLQGML